jgi:hypothetical protein
MFLVVEANLASSKGDNFFVTQLKYEGEVIAAKIKNGTLIIYGRKHRYIRIITCQGNDYYYYILGRMLLCEDDELISSVMKFMKEDFKLGCDIDTMGDFIVKVCDMIDYKFETALDVVYNRGSIIMALQYGVCVSADIEIESPNRVLFESDYVNAVDGSIPHSFVIKVDDELETLLPPNNWSYACNYQVDYGSLLDAFMVNLRKGVLPTKGKSARKFN